MPIPTDLQSLPCVAQIANTSLDELIGLFGPPIPPASETDTEPSEQWVFQYPCGLQLLYKLDLHRQTTLVIPDVPELQHVADHLPFSSARIELISASKLAEERERTIAVYPQWQMKFEGLSAFQVYRQGDDGNTMPVGHRTSERAAKCRVRELESHKHKQIYWYSAH